MDQLPDVLGPPEILEPVVTEVDERGLRRETDR